MEALWFGDDGDSFFNFDSIAKNRHIKYPMMPEKLASLVGNDANVRIQPKQPGELRILSADIGLMSSRKQNNDASAIFINQMLPTKAKRYTNNIVYGETSEGLHTDDQALNIRRLYDEFQCDYIVLDSNGVGLGVFDALVRDISDPDTGEVYPALSCCNDPSMAERCTTPNAEKVIWSIKGSAKLNSECAVLLREGFRSGKIRLLMTEYDAEEFISALPGYKKLSPTQKTRLQLPYINTTLLIDELVKLQHEENNGNLRVYERTGARKDRYSSISYNYYVSTQLEAKLGRKRDADVHDVKLFMYRPPKIK